MPHPSPMPFPNAKGRAEARTYTPEHCAEILSEGSTHTRFRYRNEFHSLSNDQRRNMYFRRRREAKIND